MRMRKQGQAWIFQRCAAGLSNGNLGSISVSYPQFFEKQSEKFKKYEHFNLCTDNLLSFNAF